MLRTAVLVRTDGGPFLRLRDRLTLQHALCHLSSFSLALSTSVHSYRSHGRKSTRAYLIPWGMPHASLLSFQEVYNVHQGITEPLTGHTRSFGVAQKVVLILLSTAVSITGKISRPSHDLTLSLELFSPEASRYDRQLALDLGTAISPR